MSIRDELAARGVDTSHRFADATFVDCLVGGSGHEMSVYLKGSWWCQACHRSGDSAEELWRAMADAVKAAAPSP